jgi:ATP-dependent Clp protease ATP-binding subunit ClpX
MVSKKKKGGFDKDDYRCSFCNKPSSMVSNLISGPDVYICSDCVEICSKILEDDKRVEESGINEYTWQKFPPIKLIEELDEYVIGQNHAKKVLAVAVYNHLKRIYSRTINSDVELEKSNIILMGPTGCGKTLLVKTMARLLNVPLAISDATALTQAGYVGEDVENCLLRLYQAADGDVERAQKGIVYIDEIDKIGRKSENASITRDVGGEGVQQALLKIIEGSVVQVPAAGGRKHPMGEMINLDTTNVLFIVGGSFVGLEELVSKRIGKNAGIGFNKEQKSKADTIDYTILRQVEPEDLVKFGLIPELIGRLPVSTALEPLSKEHLVKILSEPKNAILKQYQRLFSLEDLDLSFDKKALEMVAVEAHRRKTGARGLRAIFEEVMLDMMCYAPGGSKKKYLIKADYVTDQLNKFRDTEQKISISDSTRSKADSAA